MSKKQLSILFSITGIILKLTFYLHEALKCLMLPLKVKVKSEVWYGKFVICNVVRVGGGGGGGITFTEKSQGVGGNNQLLPSPYIRLCYNMLGVSAGNYIPAFRLYRPAHRNNTVLMAHLRFSLDYIQGPG